MSIPSVLIGTIVKHKNMIHLILNTMTLQYNVNIDEVLLIITIKCS